MVDGILQALHEVEGVQASLVMNGAGQLLAHRAHAVYDRDLLADVSRTIVNALDSLQLVHDDWEMLTASFADGKLLVRNLNAGRDGSGVAVALAVVADARLNASFAGVAMRVAASRLKNATPAPLVAPPPPRAAPPPVPVRAPAVLPVVAASPSAEIDGRAAAFLASCTKALAASVGPMAKVFVREAVTRVCGGGTFSRDQAYAVVAALEAHIEDPSERAQFRKATIE
jgi:predicted regulator of Ras-like GTPase activity (Roadblock/LC7/MglB family)